jgi:putative ABC transport system permease protein
MRLSGRLRAALVIGIQGIRARKLRTLLSMASLFLGVLAVVIVQAASVSAERAALRDVELVQGLDGTRQMYLQATNTSVPVILDTVTRHPEAVAVGNVQATIGEPGVRPINEGGSTFDDANGPSYEVGPPSQAFKCGPNGCFVLALPDQNGGQPKPRGAAIQLQMVALTADIRQYKPFRPVAGEWLDFTTMPSMAPGIVLNTAAAKGFTKYRVPAQLSIPGATADPTPRIVGVVDDGQPVPMAYVRMDEMRNWLPAATLAATFGSLAVYLPAGGSDVERILTTRLVAAGVDPRELQVQTLDARRSIQRSLLINRIIFFGLAGLVLLIGVGGILNVGLATVGERVEEFALRRAVGTPRLLLAGIVLAETLLTGLLTAAAAIGAAALALRFAGSYLANREPALASIGFPWQAAAAGVVAGLVAGVLGGLIPAIRAARIPIATVMRA